MSNNTIPTGRFVWFEYVAKDLDKAQGFFGELFNWKTQAMPMPQGGNYTMIAVDNQTIGGYMPTPEGAPPHAHWLSHLGVADTVATCAKIKTLGGKVLKEPMKMGDVGTWAVVADPSGAAFALWQPGKANGDGNFKGKTGTWCWNELMTTDPDKCIAFYKDIGGFQANAMPMPQGTYHVLEFDGAPRAGVMQATPPQPTAWLPYVQVVNADQTSAKVTKLGGKVIVPPTDIPTVGRFSIFTDTNGAALGILQPAPR
jgi:predicted enzyme related to lactoylglutathione lyase